MSALRASRFVAGGAPRDLRVSFEFFPPKTPEMEQSLWECVSRLAPLRPNFVSVTYGAGGSTRERTHATVKRILAETALIPAAHLTCVAASRADMLPALAACAGIGDLTFFGRHAAAKIRDQLPGRHLGAWVWIYGRLICAQKPHASVVAAKRTFGANVIG